MIKCKYIYMYTLYANCCILTVQRVQKVVINNVIGIMKKLQQRSCWKIKPMFK